MSQLLINAFHTELARIHRMSGSTNEQTIREAFKRLLHTWSRSRDLDLVTEHPVQTPQGKIVYPDGTILYELRVPLGYWEAKDTKDDLDAEIEDKFRKGYPQDNILFENSAEAVLYQNRREVMRCAMTDTEQLGSLLDLFFGYEPEAIKGFRKAVETFKTDLPAVLDALREKIDTAYKSNTTFAKAAARFLDHVKTTVNPALAEADVREMLIQHVLTEEIFAKVFDQGAFHRENNIARALYDLEATFLDREAKQNLLRGMKPYYAAIYATAQEITGHGEKQRFLKVIYENFYKVYNPKAADRLGVVYTPNEIVHFMIEGADWLCHKHFGKAMIEPGVDILDPATGTGTFICELIEHFAGQPKKLAHKFKEELHANEVAILPYYVANLNIEATYAAVSGQFAEYPNLCFVDTLDNVEGLGLKRGDTRDLFASFSDENVARVKRQNMRHISVVIGNPPYNAWQENFNSRNPNRPYRHVDDRIKRTYIKEGTAQNSIAVYDMYTRFFRWASDRLTEDGLIAFVTNRSFTESRTFDGFRRVVADNFAEIYVVDLGGDVRVNPKLSGSKNNVFGIQTGIAISFMVKKEKAKGCKIFYIRRPEFDTAEDKLAWLGSVSISSLKFDTINPSKRGNWINQVENEWDDQIQVASKAEKAGRRGSSDRAIFSIFTNGLKTQRDEWVYDLSRNNLQTKTRYLIDTYEHTRSDVCFVGRDSIKWDRELEKYLAKGIQKKFDVGKMTDAEYRPFIKKSLYRDRHFIGMNYVNAKIWVGNNTNQAITVMGDSSGKPYFSLAVGRVPDLNFVSPASGGTQQFPRHRYSADGERHDNITDWALNKFKAAYKGQKLGITKDDIFHYVYGVLHDPVYRETYAINLKREFPRIPFYPDFKQWAAWGARLMDLHIGYETVAPYALKRDDVEDKKSREAGVPLPVKLKADKDAGTIRLDSETTLSGIPPEAWDYRLGNRSGLEWILDQYKEKKPKDATIREKFNTYRFADYKDTVIDLLSCVTTVSVETMEITEAMKAAKRPE